MPEKIALKLNKLTKIYGTGDYKVTALKGVSLSFRKSEFVSVLGPSGCGKTTLLNIVGGLDRYTDGELFINGKSTVKYDDKDWDAYRNNTIGFVFQSYNLIPHQTVLGNVEIALELSGVSKKVRKEKALKMLEKVGLKGQEHKLPKQLSGGQMQRVAIARALINDPKIILADEPTGALDTTTSIQIMEILKEISKDKLVIMVTHNPELAERYSTRIINLLDGEVTKDTNPVLEEETEEFIKRRKPKMGVKTAFLLSLKNLFSKKARTILTSVAGSIGIIGVALVLALSNGFNAYMAQMQTDTLSSFPLTISESSVDLSTFDKMYETDVVEKYPKLDNVFVHKAFDNLTGMLKSNKLSDLSENGFVSYLENHKNTNKDLYYTISYNYGFDMNEYFFTDVSFNSVTNFTSIDTLVSNIQKQYDDRLQSAMGLSTDFVRQYIPTITEMPDYQLVKEQYDVLYGDLPEFTDGNANKMVVVVDEYNSLTDITLALLGYLDINIENTSSGGVEVTFAERESLSIQEIVGKEIYLADNSSAYINNSGKWYSNYAISGQKDSLEKLEIVGVLRAKKNVEGVLPQGIAYMPNLTRKVLLANENSDIVKAVDAQTGKVSIYNLGSAVPVEYTARKLAGVKSPTEIKIFAKDFESKEIIKSHIESWNDLHENEEDKISYSDMMSMMFGMLTTMVDAVTYVLVAFTSISLVVSSVMIGIITYISVVERTKEIGVLRSLGASKRDISSVFNAETFSIGLFSGLIGVGFTYLISIPLNIILRSLVAGVGRLVILSPLSALILVVISVSLTLIAGLIPSKIAAKKDPVIALRTE